MTYVDGSIDCRVRFTDDTPHKMAKSLDSLNDKMDLLIQTLRANNQECVNEDMKAENDRLRNEYRQFYMTTIDWILKTYGPFGRRDADSAYGTFLCSTHPEGLSEEEINKVLEARKMLNGYFVGPR